MNIDQKAFGRAARLATGAAILVLTTSACSSGASSGGGAAKGTSPAAGAGPAKGGVATIAARRGSLGIFLTNGAGDALYAFAADRSGTSACSGACATYWPPLTTTGASRASGAAKSADLGTIRRSDGSMQVTYAGHPLYRFAGDRSPGDTSGQGLSNFGGKWWLVSTSGADITGSGSGSGSTSSAGGGGY